MPNVHSGHRDYLVRTVQSKEWIKIAQKLPSCRSAQGFTLFSSSVSVEESDLRWPLTWRLELRALRCLRPLIEHIGRHRGSMRLTMARHQIPTFDVFGGFRLSRWLGAHNVQAAPGALMPLPEAV